jgi:EAL domain-containing protein (putative c-di-GMP-specific phosphodiesterase class I)
MSLVESISKFAGSMGMMCVVEGVEHFDQVIALRSVGLDIGQGPKFSPPISAQNCEVLLARSFPHSVRSPQPSSSNVSTSTR